jgi:HK97 family phage portal protein
MAAYFGYNPGEDVSWVSERAALGLSAFWRAGSLISGTIATLPLSSYRTSGEGERMPVTSWLDDPGKAVDLTAFEWKEQVVWHLFLGGDAFLFHLFNGAGALAGALPIHPRSVQVEWITDADRAHGLVGRKKYDIVLTDGNVIPRLDSRSLTQIMGPSLDGLRGMSIISLAGTSLATAMAGDRSALKMFQNGGMISAIATPDEDLDEGEDEILQRDLDAKMTGVSNTARIAVMNRRMKITPWSMSATDAEFLAQRQFSIEEVSRWTGVPPHLLMQTDKQTSWGTGVAEQNLGLRQYNLMGYTSRMEARLNRLTPNGQLSLFDYSELERPSPKDEADLAIRKYQGGLLTRNEARHKIGETRVVDGDEFIQTQATVAADAAGDPPEDGGTGE